MNAKPTLARCRFLSCFIAALLSAVISAGLLGAVGGLFLSDGLPFGKVVAAERTGDQPQGRQGARHQDHSSAVAAAQTKRFSNRFRPNVRLSR